MADLTPSDEELIKRFVGLHTEDHRHASVQIPKRATSSTAWDLTLLLKVVTDRTILDSPFISAMLTAWDSPTTVIRPVMKNCYLAEFENKDDLLKASLGGPWTYRGGHGSHSPC